MLTQPSQPVESLAPSPTVGVPLCVDLDGTLVKTNTLYESLFALVRNHPLQLLWLPLWLLRGRAFLKRALALRAIPDARLLPYREDLLAHLTEEHARGRHLVLATGADELIARAVADHLELFDEVVGSDGRTNLTGSRKLAELGDRFTSFDYAGDSRADLPIWRHARRGIVVSASTRLIAQARGSTSVERVFPANESGLKTIVRAVRVHQWAKNVLLFVPALAAHCLMD